MTALIYKIKIGWTLETGDACGRLLPDSKPVIYPNKAAAKKAAKEQGLKPWNY